VDPPLQPAAPPLTGTMVFRISRDRAAPPVTGPRSRLVTGPLSDLAGPQVVAAWQREGVEDTADLANWWVSASAVREWARSALPSGLHGEAVQGWAAARQGMSRRRPTGPPVHASLRRADQPTPNSMAATPQGGVVHTPPTHQHAPLPCGQRQCHSLR